MQLGPRGIALILDYEKFSSAPYLDQVGVWTIGYGTTRINGQRVGALTPPCTPEQAWNWFLTDAAVVSSAVTSMLKVPVTQNQFDSLVCFSYNVGDGALKSSSLLSAINSRQPVTQDLFTRWSKVHVNGVVTTSNGLTARRHAEYILFTTP